MVSLRPSSEIAYFVGLELRVISLDASSNHLILGILMVEAGSLRRKKNRRNLICFCFFSPLFQQICPQNSFSTYKNSISISFISLHLANIINYQQKTKKMCCQEQCLKKRGQQEPIQKLKQMSKYYRPSRASNIFIRRWQPCLEVESAR